MNQTWTFHVAKITDFLLLHIKNIYTDMQMTPYTDNKIHYSNYSLLCYLTMQIFHVCSMANILNYSKYSRWRWWWPFISDIKKKPNKPIYPHTYKYIHIDIHNFIWIERSKNLVFCVSKVLQHFRININVSHYILYAVC